MPWWHSARLRDALFLAGLAACVLLLGNFALVHTVMEPRARLMGISAAAEIGAIHDSYQRLPTAQRQAWLDSLLAASRGGLVRAPRGPGQLAPADNALQNDVMRVMQGQLPGIQVGFAPGDSRAVWFALPAEGGERIWLKLPTGRPGHQSAIMAAAWGSGGVLVVLGGLLAIGWRQQQRLRGAGQAFAHVGAEGGTAGAPSPPSLAVVAPAPPPDLPDARSLEELVRVMSGRMQSLERQRNGALQEVAQAVRAALADASPAQRQAQPLASLERLAGQFEAFSTPQALATQPPQPVDLNALVERCTRQAPVGVMLGLAPVPPLPLRPAAMECLVDNLLRNALSHGGGQAVLTTGEEGEWVVLRVLDRGELLADDELALLGRPFYRTDAARAQGLAAGLGLALARHIAQLHDGELKVLRRDGGGLAVEVRLPRPPVDATAPPPPPPRRPRPAWMGLAGDLAVMAIIWMAALGLGLSMLNRTVIEPNLQLSIRAWVNILGGMTGAYATLPPAARPAYLDDLRRYSGGLIEPAEPDLSGISLPRLSGTRSALVTMRAALPELELMTSPLPDSALWMHLPSAPGGPPGPWLRMRTPIYSDDFGPVLLGVALLVGASASFLVLRARRRLDWTTEVLREGRGDLQAQVRAHGGSQALADSLQVVRQRFMSACQRLAQAKDEQELLLARLLQDLQAATAGLRPSGATASLGEENAKGPGQPADPWHHAFDALVHLALPPTRGEGGITQVNTLLTALPLEPAVIERQAVRWSLCGVPFAALREDEARRLFVAVLHYLLAQQAQAIEISSGMENGWVVVRFTEQGGHTDPGAATQALMMTCHFAESRGGFMRFGRAPGGGGAQVEILLPPARLS